jgi:hypothetical protein
MRQDEAGRGRSSRQAAHINYILNSSSSSKKERRETKIPDLE